MYSDRSNFNYFGIWLFLGGCLVITVIYLSLSTPPKLPDVEFADKYGHILAYASLAFWFGQLFTRLNSQFAIFIIFSLMGVALEYLQGLGQTRMFEYADMVANIIGAALGWLLTRTLFSGVLLRVESIIIAFTHSEPKGK